LFVLHHEEEINSLPENPILVTPLFHECSTLVSTLFNLMTALESSRTSLARAYPLIREAVQVLDRSAQECSVEGLSDVYRIASQVVASYLLQSTYDLVQLAYVLTPQGRKEARRQLMGGMHDVGTAGRPSDEGNDWLTQQPQVEEVELFAFESDFASRDEEVDDPDLEGDGEEEEDSPIGEDTNDYVEDVDDSVPPTSDDLPVKVLSNPEPWD
jgi:hypothetical protein